MARKKQMKKEIIDVTEPAESEIAVKSEFEEKKTDNQSDLIGAPTKEMEREDSQSKIEFDNRINELQEQLEQERDKRLRVLAEYDNFRKRTQQEFQQIIQSAGERLIKQLLPVLDDFERLFDHDAIQADNAALHKGVELIYQKLTDILSAEGLQSISAINEPFNAEIHEALAQIEDDTKPEGTILNEIEKGYRLGNKIIRFSKVMVSTASKSEDRAADE